MTATRKVDMIRGDRAMHGLPSSACTQRSIDPVHLTLCSVTELAFGTQYFRSLCSFAFKVGRKTAAWQRVYLFCATFLAPLLGCMIVNADLLKYCILLKVLLKVLYETFHLDHAAVRQNN